MYSLKKKPLHRVNLYQKKYVYSKSSNLDSHIVYKKEYKIKLKIYTTLTQHGIFKCGKLAFGILL